MIGVILTATIALHPLGNFSVNQLVSLSLYPDRVEAVAIVDLAELPSLQLTPACTDVARDLTVTAAGDRLQWTVSSTELEHQPGAAGLDTTRLTCHLTAPAKLDRPAQIEVTNGYLPGRIGWHELTATGRGVNVTGLPTSSVTGKLRTYPADLLSSPPDVRSARLTAAPGSTSDTAPVSIATAQTSPLIRAEQWLHNTVGDRGLTPWVGLLAVMLALLLGAGHAALPGHGKTVMAIYLAGRAGRSRDAFLVGATVTATHTGAVLILGLLLTGAASLTGETILGWAGLASGILVTIVGTSMLIATLRRKKHQRHPPHKHSHEPGHPHDQALARDHALSHGHAAGHGSSHGHAAGHSHGHVSGHRHGVESADGHRHDAAHRHSVPPAPARGLGMTQAPARRAALAALGIAGGLVPSPSALIVLLGAIALGRTGFGVLLVLAYGLGMAATLTIAGLTLLRVRDRLRGRLPRLTWLRPAAPYATGSLVLMVGLGLATRAVTAVI